MKLERFGTRFQFISRSSLFCIICGFLMGQGSFAQTSTLPNKNVENTAESSSVLSVGSSTSSLSDLFESFKQVKKGQTQFSSESFYSNDFAFVTDSRLRYLQPVFENDIFETEAFIDAFLQYQSQGASQQYLKNNVGPSVGVKTVLYKTVGLLLQTGYKKYVGQQNQGEPSEWDPKAILAADNFWQWDNPRIFSEGAVELAYLPRLDPNNLAATLSLKQGFRFKPMSSITFDTLGELYRLESHSTNLGLSDTEYRLGVRSMWEGQSWNVAANIFHAYDRIESYGDIDGIISIEGKF